MFNTVNENNFISLIKTLVRYLASGFVFIIVFEFLIDDDTIWSFTKDNIRWTVVFAAGICGLLIYSVHSAFLDDIFYWLSLRLALKKAKEGNYAPREFSGEINTSAVMFQLTTYRYMQTVVKTDEEKAMQSKLEQLLALLVFLYTSSYSLFFLPLAFTAKAFISHPLKDIQFSWAYFGCFLFGLFLMLSGFILDLKITKRELYMVKRKEL